MCQFLSVFTRLLLNRDCSNSEQSSRTLAYHYDRPRHLGAALVISEGCNDCVDTQSISAYCSQFYFGNIKNGETCRTVLQYFLGEGYPGYL